MDDRATYFAATSFTQVRPVVRFLPPVHGLRGPTTSRSMVLRQAGARESVPAVCPGHCRHTAGRVKGAL